MAISAAMRVAVVARRRVILAVLAGLGCGGLGCGGPATVAGGRRAEISAHYGATRWIPAQPTYVVAARTLRDAQRTLIDTIESFGLLARVDVAEVSDELRQVFVVDPLSADALGAVGIDVGGGVAVFSEATNPTLVVHLAAPEQTRAFLDQERARGTSRSQLVGEVELFTASLDEDLHVSWAIDRDWLWVHFAIGAEDGVAWFRASHDAAPGRAGAWTSHWDWAHGDGAHPGLVGFVDLRRLAAKLAPRLDDAVACTELIAPVGRAGFTFEGAGKHAEVRVAFDVGPAASSITRAILPAPEGWDAVAAGAPLAVQWNLDLVAARSWIAPCARLLGFDLSALDRYGLRAVRALVQRLDVAAKDGAGAVALDLSGSHYVARLLDRIPLRSTLEASQRYGPHAGKRLSVPLGPTLDYVLTDRLALAAVGDGLLARVVGGGAGAAASPVFALDVTPAGLPVAAWAFLLERAEIPQAAWIAERLASWRTGRVTIRVEGTRLVFEASGDRS